MRGEEEEEGEGEEEEEERLTDSSNNHELNDHDENSCQSIKE